LVFFQEKGMSLYAEDRLTLWHNSINTAVGTERVSREEIREIPTLPTEFR